MENSNISSSIEGQKQPFKLAQDPIEIINNEKSNDQSELFPSVHPHPVKAALPKKNAGIRESRADALSFPKRSNIMLGLIILSVWGTLLKLSCCPSSLEYLVTLPFIAFWSYWLFCIDYACGLRYRCPPPVKPSTLVLVSLSNFIFLPLVGDMFFQPLLDPFFYAWLLSLVYVPYRIGSFLEEKENTNKKILPYVLSAGAVVLPLLAGVLSVSAKSNPGLMLAFAWILSQTSWISYVANKLLGRFDDSVVSKQIKTRKIHAGTNIVMRYRAFPELERWLEHKFNSNGLLKGRHALIMWFGAPPLVLATIILVSSVLSNWTGQSPVATTVISQTTNASYALIFLYYFFALILAVPTVLVLKPTHLFLGEKGFGFLWRRRFFKFDGAPISWKGLSYIFIQHPVSQSSAALDNLCFQGELNKTTRIRLNCIDSFEDKELLLKAINTWAPKVKKDAAVKESLQPPSGYSYTELWLQALTAPPKRDRFKPLVHDAFLKNNSYRILGSLGSGGQGFAYLAEDCSEHKEIVLKEFILPVYVDVRVRKSALEQFENEARILSRLENPQIVHLKDYFVEDHRAYLVLEHIEGASLQEIVKYNGPLKEKEIVVLALQMCDILSYLHSQVPPVVHRDFTPDNLLLGTDGILKLIDFNVAQSSGSATTTGTVVGKPAYLPPEQFRGMPTSQSDIYAMGATLYFILTGQEPEPISVSHPIEVNSAVSFELNHIVVKATQLEVNNRYSEIHELKQALLDLRSDSENLGQ